VNGLIKYSGTNTYLVHQNSPDMTKKDILDLFAAIDRFDTETFASYLDEEARFKFANIPVITGKNNIFEFVAGFFQSIKAIKHKNFEIYELDGIRFVLANVTYTRLDGTTLSVDFSNTFKLKGNKIKDYLIFIDNSELFR
jgi:hypothetical protein